jgi:hypothetical protein
MTKPSGQAADAAPPVAGGDSGSAVGKPWARILEVAAVALGLLYALIFWARLPSQLPSDQDYAALQATVQQEQKPGDGVAVLPFWADHAKVFLHGLPVLALPNLDGEPDAERFQRLWVVSQPSLPRSDARDSLEALGRRLDSAGPPRRFGPLELWLFTPKAGRAATWDFVAHSGEAQAQSNGPVQVQWHEFDYLPRRCFLIGGQAILSFPNVTMAHGIRLGLGGGQDAQVQVSVDGHPIGPFTYAPGGAAFQTQELPIPGLSAGDHAVDLNLRGRGACLDAVAF